MPQSAGLSVCMIVRNESENLAGALESFSPFADEIVIVDTGSSDGTKEIAASYTSRVYDFEWIEDFSAARNFAMSKASRSYQLWLDADDRITPENGRRIEELKLQFNGRQAFYFILEMHRPGSSPSCCLQLRCTPIIPELRFEGRVHEQIFPSVVRAGLEQVTTEIAVRHSGYVDEKTRMAKNRRNLAIMERERADGRDDGALHFFLAVTYAPLGMRQEAVVSMEKALERFEIEQSNPSLIPEGYLVLAKLAFEVEDYDRCTHYLSIVRSLVKGSPAHNFNMGIIYQRMGKHREALEVFREVSGQDYTPVIFATDPLPNPRELLLHMAYSWYCLDRHREALELINASAPQGIGACKSWEWMGTKAFIFGNVELAAVAFETAMRHGTLQPASWQHLAAVYKQKGFSRKAEECLLRAKGHDSSFPGNDAKSHKG